MCAEIAQVLKAYSSSSPELLNLESGQLILILSKNASGWWLGELQVRGFSPLTLIRSFAYALLNFISTDQNHNLHANKM